MKELLTALANVKKEVGTLSKTETNPFFKSKYFDINSLIQQVEPLLEKNGLVLLQPILNGVVTSEIYHVETAQKISSEIALGNISDPQKLGSAITYYRRYTLQSLLGLQAEDDDGNKASQPQQPTIDVARLETRLNACKTLSELQTTYLSFTQAEQKATAKLATELKTKFSK
jgi:hypothetical protein